MCTDLAQCLFLVFFPLHFQQSLFTIAFYYSTQQIQSKGFIYLEYYIIFITTTFCCIFLFSFCLHISRLRQSFFLYFFHLFLLFYFCSLYRFISYSLFFLFFPFILIPYIAPFVKLFFLYSAGIQVGKVFKKRLGSLDMGWQQPPYDQEQVGYHIV